MSQSHRSPSGHSETERLLEAARKATEHLSELSNRADTPWQPSLKDPRRLHNNYVRNLADAYLSKFAELSKSLLAAIDREDYLTYALCGRSQIEAAATLRYYVVHKYRPLIMELRQKGSVETDDYRRLLEIDDQHLRGSRFDWESFLQRRYSKMKDDIIAVLKAKGQKGQQKRADLAQSLTAQQVNVLTCVEKWADETPEALIAYNLFCELVHPNVGSNFLVSSRSSEKMYFAKNKGENVGRYIFEESFPLLLAVTHKPLAKFLTALMGTCWQEHELT
jgi:hypothetical protein